MRAPMKNFAARLPNKAIENKHRFTRVYLKNSWRDPETRSGPGSVRGSGCVVSAIEALELAVRDFGVQTIGDVACGDFNWMPEFLQNHPDIHYHGYDVVDLIVGDNTKRFPYIPFSVLDVSKHPPGKFDLILCKDLFNHLRFADVQNALQNIKKSGSTYLLASNNFGCLNEELARPIAGMSRMLDITRAPLNYPQPIWRTHYLGLWRLADFP